MASKANASITAEKYYNSDDADQFYSAIWGGEDIHIGIYETHDEQIHSASRRTVEQMATLLKGVGAGSRVLDFGAGYGGAARYLAANYGCHVTCLNLSEVQNERNATLTREQGLDHLVTIKHGVFEDVSEPDARFDVVWSQDAILHSGDRKRVFEEARRVLVKGGQLILQTPCRQTCARHKCFSRYWTVFISPLLDRLEPTSRSWKHYSSK